MLLKILLIMGGVAFITLLERKVLGGTQLRTGPYRFLQPILDALKLLSKETALPFQSMQLLFYLAPSLSFILMAWIINTLDSKINSISFLYNTMYFLLFVGLGVYSSLLSGWASYSKYGMIGAVRSCAQTISYEVCLFIFFMPVIIMENHFHLSASVKLVMTPIIAAWFVIILAELNRAPFDFSEGESELISGFNIEKGGILFTLLFLAEYGMIIFFSFFTSYIMFGGSVIISMAFFMLILTLRSVLPRYRYDKLMNLSWLILTPISIIFLLYVSSFSNYL